MKKVTNAFRELSEIIDPDLFYVVSLYDRKIAMQGYVTDKIFGITILKNQNWSFSGTFFMTSFRFNDILVEINLSSKSND